MEKDIELSKYIKWFSLVYFLLLIVLGTALNLLDIDGNSGLSIGVLLAAVMTAVYKFVEDNKRVPTKSEKIRLVWFSFFSSWLISLFLVSTVFLYFEGIAGFNNLIGDVSLDNLIILGIVALVISLIYFAGIYFSYGSFANSYFKALKKKNKL